MAVPGRRPLPTSLKILRGNPGKRPLNLREPTPAKLERPPSPPKFLNDRAKREWRRIARELLRLNVLASVDTASLAGYCDSVALFAEASERMKAEGLTRFSTNSKTGGVTEYPNPLLFIKAMALKQIRAFAAEFGLTPSARSRLSIPARPVEDDPNFDPNF